LRPVIRRYGVDAVWDAGLSVFGFPALWVTDDSEAAKLKLWLNTQNPFLK
jgi:hypothetical protein